MAVGEGEYDKALACLPKKERTLLSQLLDAKEKTLRDLHTHEKKNAEDYGMAVTDYPADIMDNLDSVKRLRSRLRLTADTPCEEFSD